MTFLGGVDLVDRESQPDIVCIHDVRHVAPYWIHVKFAFKTQHEGQTIEAALRLVKTTRPSAKWWLRELSLGRLVLQNGIVASEYHTVKKYDVVEGKYHFHEQSILHGSEPLTVVHQDEKYLVVNKPGGVDVLSNPDAGRVFNSLPGLMADELGLPEIYPAHRIDNHVSGLVCCGRTRTDAKCLSRRIELGETEKTYLARVQCSPAGIPSLPITIDAPLSFDKQSSVAFVDGKKGKPSRTSILECLGRFKDGTAVLAIRPHTGRKHQLRCHLKHVGLSIANDTRYGGSMISEVPYVFFGANRKTVPRELTSLLSSNFVEDCEYCLFARDVIAGENDKDGPTASTSIWLHSWRYSFPTLGLSFESPIPDWAQR